MQSETAVNEISFKSVKCEELSSVTILYIDMFAKQTLMI